MPATLESHILRRDSVDLDTTLPHVLALSNEIFSAEPGTKYTSLVYWKEQLSHDISAIIYLTTSEPKASSIPSNPRPIAFLFAHPRTHSPPLKDGTRETLHIWLAGVLPEQRKMGCLGKMMQELIKDSTSLHTICTTPSRFPDMWTWLCKRGWQREKDFEEGKIMLSKIGNSH
ncbi:hypothetical protein BDW22DRAFT_22356 [Trametopsis cervina]|nr:hypothetical protein BDW22DRAFT_22356 [Trametopsis cervina]